MTFIVTGSGFVKAKKHIDKGVYEILYTDKLREAMQVGRKFGEKFLRENNLVGFLYNPKIEEVVKNRYEVKKQNNDNWSLFEKDTVDFTYYTIQKVAVKRSDLNFLNERTDPSLSYAEAVKLAIEQNKRVALKVNEKIKEIYHSLEKENINSVEEFFDHEKQTTI